MTAMIGLGVSNAYKRRVTELKKFSRNRIMGMFWAFKVAEGAHPGSGTIFRQ